MMNMSSRARSWFVRKRKKPIGRAVATNENYYPMKICPSIKRKKTKEYVHIELMTSSGKCPFS